jgi:prephenate dehydrogenase
VTDHLTVVGTGLIGGSIALAARSRQPGMTVTGYDADPASIEAALERGAINRVSPTLHQAVEGADLIVLALPVDRIPSTCRDLGTAVPDSAVVTDVGSAKVAVVSEGEAAFGDRFVGGHPMAGSERHGIEAADRTLFESAWWILTPTPTTSSGAYSKVSRLVMQLGAIPVAVDPVVHDTLVARLSHLPQLTAAALVGVALESEDRDALLGLAGGGFRDVTRIAASNPDLWVTILRSNRRAVLEALEGFTGALGEVAGMISGDRWEELRAWLDRSRGARLALFSKPDYGGRPVALSMMVPDRPGVLAEVTKAAGELGANIEDLRITHSTEGGRGRLELVVAGSRASDLLAKALGELGYRVERSEGPGDA